MVNHMKTIPITLIQMIQSKMAIRFPRTSVAEFSLETPLEELGLDSLDKLCLLFEIEELFHVTIPDITAAQMKCGKDILAFVSGNRHE